MRRRLGAAALIVVMVLGTAGAALGHAGLKGSSPRKGAVLKRPPAKVVLAFSEPVGRVVSVHATRGGRGELVRRARIDPRNASRVRITLARPGRRAWAGRYRIAWRVVSADGHVVRGVLVYRVRR